MRSPFRLAFLGFTLCALVSCNDDNAPTQPPMTTPTPLAATATPPVATATPPAATPTPSAARTVRVENDRFVDAVSGNSTTTIRAGDRVEWAFVSSLHSTTSGNCCTPDGIWNSGTRSTGNFSHAFPTAGSFPYFCVVHGSMMTGTVIVNP